MHKYVSGNLKRLWPRHFSSQVKLLTFAIVLFCTFTLTAYQITRVNQFQYDNARDRLLAIANNVSLGVTHSLITKDYAAIELLLRRAANFPDIRSISVVNPTGRAVSSVVHKPPWPPEPVFTTQIHTLPKLKSTIFQWTYGSNEQAHPFAFGMDATALTIWQPIENANLGWVTINFSVENIREDAFRLIRNSILFSLATLVLLTLLMARFLRPNLRALSEATTFAEGLYHIHGQQIPTFQGSAEIESLNCALNEASNKLYTQEEKLVGSNRLLSNVLDAASEVSIIATNLNGIVTVFNRGSEQLLGYTADEVLNKLSPVLFHVAEEITARAKELSDQLGYAVNGFRTLVVMAEQMGSEQREWVFIRRDGSLVPVSLVVTTMRAIDGEITGYLGIAQDITERKQNDKLKGEFVSTVSHELRTPLTAISGALGLILGGALGEMPENAKQMLNIAYKNSQRLTFLINDLLDMEKLVAGKMHFDIKQQLLMPLVEQAIEGNRTYGADRRVNLVITHAEQDIQIYVDGQRLLQVLSNLLSNAIKYSPDDGIVEVSVLRLDKIVQVSVRDFGPGIPDEFRDRIFGKFSQADSSDTRKKGGSGLGLFITRELVQRMGGKIHFDSTEGEGAIFNCEFPLAYILEAHSVNTVASPEIDAPRILVIEDEEDIAKLLSIMLTRAGYAVDIALNGQMALSHLKSTRYTAVTLDLMLPDISGLEIIRLIRTQPETETLPIVVVSAKMEEGKLSINGDFSDICWLSKPIDESLLLSTINNSYSEASGRPLRVLHVEDNVDLHHVVCAIVGKNFNVELATTLHDARSLINQNQYDLLIMDLDLPDGSGWHLLPEIRKQQPRARVVILSGTDTSPEEARKVDAVLLKSQVSPQELLAALGSSIQST